MVKKKVISNLLLLSFLGAFTISCNKVNSINNPVFPSGDLITDQSFSSKKPDDSYPAPIGNEKPPVFAGNYQEILNSWDSDKTDKGLTRREILKAADQNQDSSLSIEELEIAGLTPEESKLVLDRIKEIPAPETSLVYELVELDPRVFPGGITKISESDIRQGKRNVCYFLSSLAGLAFNNRGKEILRLIDKNRDGTFTITFPGIKEENNKFTVGFPTEEDFGKLIFRGKNNSGWAAIMVNAYHKYGEKGRPFKHIFAKDFVSDYGLTWEGIEVQSGHKADGFLLNFYRNEKIMNALKKAIDNKLLVTVCTFMKGNISTPINPKKNEIKFSKAHILTVTGVDLLEQTVTIRDPYGQFEYYDENGAEKINKETDGFITLPVTDLKKYFLDLSIETTEKGTFRGVKNIFEKFL